MIHTIFPRPLTSTRGRVAAGIVARRMLAPHTIHTTRDPYCYHRDTRWAHTATVVLPGGSRDVHEAPVVMGPSVAERGVW